jgi:hypothetical protein
VFLFFATAASFVGRLLAASALTAIHRRSGLSFNTETSTCPPFGTSNWLHPLLGGPLSCLP